MDCLDIRTEFINKRNPINEGKHTVVIPLARIRHEIHEMLVEYGKIE